MGTIAGFLLGILCCPLIIFLRARRCSAWDDSNMMNIYRVVAYLAVNPEKFGEMKLKDGSRPFWYINKDEFSEVVNGPKIVD